MRFTIMAGLALLAIGGMAHAQPAAPSAAAAPAYSTRTTQLSTLLADPAAKAVLAKHIPQMLERQETSEQAAGMTLREIQDAVKAYSPDALSDKVLDAIDADLAKLPAKH